MNAAQYSTPWNLRHVIVLTERGIVNSLENDMVNTDTSSIVGESHYAEDHSEDDDSSRAQELPSIRTRRSLNTHTS